MNTNLIFLLSQLKVASISSKENLIVPNTKLTIELLTVLYKEGLIQTFNKIYSLRGKTSKIIIHIRYFYNQPVYKNLKIMLI